MLNSQFSAISRSLLKRMTSPVGVFTAAVAAAAAVAAGGGDGATLGAQDPSVEWWPDR